MQLSRVTIASVSASLIPLLCSLTWAASGTESLDQWISSQTQVSRERLLRNISPADTARGVVVASPSKADPNYFFHWVRDAALVMDTVLSLSERETSPAVRDQYRQMMWDFVQLSRKNQETPNPSDLINDSRLGEPKFYADGSAFMFPWGRPQNDGPALRAIALTRFARQLMAEGQFDLVKKHLYDNKIPAHTVIKADLEFVSHHWRDPSFDLWEENRGQQFYTLVVQRRSLLMGADLADALDDKAAAAFYRSQAKALEPVIQSHWDGMKGFYVITLNRDMGLDYKWSGLDVGVVLAVLHGYAQDGFLAPTDDRILASAIKIEESFVRLYNVNLRFVNEAGTAIGRYPEDQYDGYGGSGGGNPWVLATLAYAELYYKAAQEWDRLGKITLTPTVNRFLASLNLSFSPQSLGTAAIQGNDPRFTEILQQVRLAADGYFKRVRLHAGPGGSLAEQINRDSGFMQGARDLTWSYAAFLTASFARGQAPQVATVAPRQ